MVGEVDGPHQERRKRVPGRAEDVVGERPLQQPGVGADEVVLEGRDLPERLEFEDRSERFVVVDVRDDRDRVERGEAPPEAPPSTSFVRPGGPNEGGRAEDPDVPHHDGQAEQRADVPPGDVASQQQRQEQRGVAEGQEVFVEQRDLGDVRVQRHRDEQKPAPACRSQDPSAEQECPERGDEADKRVQESKSERLVDHDERGDHGRIAQALVVVVAGQDLDGPIGDLQGLHDDAVDAGLEKEHAPVVLEQVHQTDGRAGQQNPLRLRPVPGQLDRNRAPAPMPDPKPDRGHDQRHRNRGARKERPLTEQRDAERDEGHQAEAPPQAERHVKQRRVVIGRRRLPGERHGDPGRDHAEGRDERDEENHHVRASESRLPRPGRSRCPGG